MKLLQFLFDVRGGGQLSLRSSVRSAAPRKQAHLAKVQIPPSKLLEHLFCSQSVVQLGFEVLDLVLGAVEGDQGRLVVG